MRTHIHHLTAALVAALIAWSGQATLATDYKASDYLPLAVGNSWTFYHEILDRGELLGPISQWPAYAAIYPDAVTEVTITVERTEAFGDTTYFLLSDMPSAWPPPPPHFLAGKKLRWEGARLMERTDTGEQSFFRFDGPTRYTIPTTEGDDVVKRGRGNTHDSAPVPSYIFTFHGFDFGERARRLYVDSLRAGRTIIFLAGYGIEECVEYIAGSDYGAYANSMYPLQAVLVGGDRAGASGASGTVRTVLYWDARRGRGGVSSSSSSSSWGEVKARSTQ